MAKKPSKTKATAVKPAAGPKKRPLAWTEQELDDAAQWIDAEAGRDPARTMSWLDLRYGAEMAERPGMPAAAFTVSIAGIEATGSTLAIALTNWANRRRRMKKA